MPSKKAASVTMEIKFDKKAMLTLARAAKNFADIKRLLKLNARLLERNLDHLLKTLHP